MDKKVEFSKVEFSRFLRDLKYYILIIIVLVIVESIIWRTADISRYKDLFIAISWVLNTLLFVGFVYLALQKAKQSSHREEFRGNCIYMVYTVVLLLVTFFGLAGLYGAILSQDEYGFIAFIPAILFLGTGAIGWFDNFTTKLIVGKGEITIKRSRFLRFLLFLGLSYDFSDIRKIKIRGPFVKIKCRERVSPATMFIPNTRKLAKVLKKYAPNKLDLK